MPLSWDTIALFVIVILGWVGAGLWLRRERRRGLLVPVGRVTRATADLIGELSQEIEKLKIRIHQLEIDARDAQSQITFLQSELALANSEVSALELLVKEQADRIADLRLENERLRRSMARIIKRTGTLESTLNPGNQS